MKHVIAISGPVASGKTVLADEILKRSSSHRISTRQLLIDAGAENDRHELIEAGKRFDRETDGKWVLRAAGKYIDRHQQCDVILIDAVRTAQQIDHLREVYGERFVHVHVEVPLEVARARYETRARLR